MKTQELINLAVSGGWNQLNALGVFKGIEAMVLDPEFWKCAGKKLKWEERIRKELPDFVYDMPCDPEDLFYDREDWTIPQWLDLQIGLVHHIANGGKIEKYLESLPDNRKKK